MMIDGLILATNNLGMNFETVILIIMLVSSIVFFARSFQIGLLILMLESAGVFIWFYTAEYNYLPILIVFLMSFITLSLSLYAMSKITKSSYGGIV